MKIALDGIPLGIVKTGVGHYTFEVAHGLAEALPDEEFQVVSHLPFIQDTTTSGSSTVPLKNLAFIEQPVNTLTKHWWTIGLPLYIRRNGINLFHGTNYDIPVWGGCPTVLTIHDLSLLLYTETHEPRRVSRARRRLPTMARIATRIIVPTQSVKREACEHLPISSEKIVVIPEAARKCFHPEGPEKARETLDRLGIEGLFILYVGAIEPRKNILTLIKAFEEIYKSTDLRPQLVVAGPTGWLSDDLFAYVKQSAVKERVLLTGYLGDEDLRALYSTCAVMCYPALYEGAGLPPLEAMACGAPVVTTQTSAIAEMVADAALLFAPTDHHALANHIIEILMDAKTRAEFVRRGLKRAAEFSWVRAAESTYQTYLEAIAENEK